MSFCGYSIFTLMSAEMNMIKHDRKRIVTFKKSCGFPLPDFKANVCLQLVIVQTPTDSFSFNRVPKFIKFLVELKNS